MFIERCTISMKRKKVIALLVYLIIMTSAGCSRNQPTNRGSGTYSYTFDGQKHEYILDLPQNVENAPLVVMLHGYGERCEGFRNNTAFEKDANALGYAVVYVTGAPNSNDRTSACGWNSGIGVSENRDVEFLCELSKYLCKECKLDSSRVFAVGFSNGAFMTHRLAMEAEESFAAVVSVSGLMAKSVWEDRIKTHNVGFFQITGGKDEVVPKNSDGSAKNAQAPAIEEVMEYWALSNDLELVETVDIGKNSILTKYASTSTEVSQKQVWNLFITNGGHSWPNEQFSGININQLILDFLETQ